MRLTNTLLQLALPLLLYVGGTAVVLSLDGGGVAGAKDSSAELERKVRTLEHRLLAPCCYQQTLDIHSSELTTQVRHEIQTRLERGESLEAVEHDLVARYGERIIAVPRASPLEGVAVFVVLAAVLAAFTLWWRARRWVHKTNVVAPPASAPAGERDEYDRALDQAIESLDRSDDR